jgi:uncharacterized protein (TIGR02266 family)
MTGDRRSAPRVRISGVRITYESASGERIEADALDLGTGGTFIRTAAPLAVGKRVSLEIQVIGKPGPWAALGRVVWTRERGEGDKAPPGMGIKLIDADDAVVAGIDHLVETRESTEPGVGAPSRPPPAVAPDPPRAEASVVAPVIAAIPERERTLLGVGASDDGMPAPPREASVPIDLIAKPPATGSTNVPLKEPDEANAIKTKRSTGRWIAIGLLLVVAAVAAYVLVTGIVKYPFPP